MPVPSTLPAVDKQNTKIFCLCTGFPLLLLGVPFPIQCSGLAAVCSLGLTKHASERSDRISDHYSSHLIYSLRITYRTKVGPMSHPMTPVEQDGAVLHGSHHGLSIIMENLVFEYYIPNVIGL